MIEPKLIIDYRERHPNLRALSDSGAVLSAIREKYSAYFPIFPSKPSPSAIAGGPSSQLWHFSPKTQVIEGEILHPVAKKAPKRCPKSSDFAKTLSKARHPSSPKWPLLLLLQILHPISPNIANTSSPRETCHLLKMKAQYIEATLFRVNYERAAWRKHTRGNKEANPPRKSISQLGKHRKEGDCNIFHKDFQPSLIQSKSHRACHELWTNGNIIWESMENGARWSLQMLSMARSLQNTNALNGEDMRGGTHGPFARHWYSPAFSLYQRYRALATVKIMFFQNMYFSM